MMTGGRPPAPSRRQDSGSPATRRLDAAVRSFVGQPVSRRCVPFGQFADVVRPFLWIGLQLCVVCPHAFPGPGVLCLLKHPRECGVDRECSSSASRFSRSRVCTDTLMVVISVITSVYRRCSQVKGRRAGRGRARCRGPSPPPASARPGRPPPRRGSCRGGATRAGRRIDRPRLPVARCGAGADDRRAHRPGQLTQVAQPDTPPRRCRSPGRPPARDSLSSERTRARWTGTRRAGRTPSRPPPR